METTKLETSINYLNDILNAIGQTYHQYNEVSYYNIVFGFLVNILEDMRINEFLNNVDCSSLELRGLYKFIVKKEASNIVKVYSKGKYQWWDGEPINDNYEITII